VLTSRTPLFIEAGPIYGTSTPSCELTELICRVPSDGFVHGLCFLSSPTFVGFRYGLRVGALSSAHLSRMRESHLPLVSSHLETWTVTSNLPIDYAFRLCLRGRLSQLGTTLMLETCGSRPRGFSPPLSLTHTYILTSDPSNGSNDPSSTVQNASLP